ncbi:MAG: alanine racemase [Pseudomonadota bacterium]|nr:alanine racemase [Pseudomonadota bacterium]
MPRPLHARIDLSALRSNLARVRALAPQAQVLAVIKADGYGHGMPACAQALAADGYALLTLEEAYGVRDLGISRPVVLLEGIFHERDLADLRATAATPVIHHAEQIRMLELSALPPPARVFLKVDTGMHRLGFLPELAAAALARLQRVAGIEQVVLMMHYACADEAGGAAEAVRRMQALRAGHPGLAALPTSFANSAAVMAAEVFGDDAAPLHGDWVRPGIMLYGASPIAHCSAASLGLKPVMQLASELIAVRQVEADEAIGYGATFRCERTLRVGVVACGYADGYPRHAPTGTPVLVDGQRTRLLGRVSMDMLCVDLELLPHAAVGTRVELFGPGLPVDEVAAAAGTIPYEILTAIARRVPRQLA